MSLGWRSMRGDQRIRSFAALASSSIAGDLSMPTGIVTATHAALTTAVIGAGLRLSGGTPRMRLQTDGGYIDFTDVTQSNRRGYLQGNAGNITLNSEVGALQLLGVGGIALTPAVINGYTMSEGVIGTRVVLATSLGYIFGNYINMTANVAAGWPTYVAGQTGDNYMRWFNKAGVLDFSSGAVTVLQVHSVGVSSGNNWTTNQIICYDQAGAQHTGISLHTGPTAPFMRAYGPFGERIDFLNNPNTAYCTICAGAFTVISSERVKKDLVELDDDELLTNVSAIRAHTFENVEPPMTIPLTDKFVDVNRRWTQRGKRPLTALGGHHAGPAEPHDCADPRHNCLGAPEHPCPITRNHTRRFGLIAEHIATVAPEATVFGEDELPQGYDVDQVAAMAFGAAGALMRKLTELTARVAELETLRS